MSYGSEAGPAQAGRLEAGAPLIPDQSDPLTSRFWSACNQRRLVIQRCQECRRFHHPPVGLCWSCLSTRLEFVPVDGACQVYSFVVVYDQRLTAFDDRTPYVVATVELSDAAGVLLRTNLANVPIDEVRIGMEVQVVFDEIAPGICLPQFDSARTDAP